jgi:hypothetical protein
VSFSLCQDGAFGAAADAVTTGFTAAEALATLLPQASVVHRLLGQVCNAAADVCPQLFGSVALSLWSQLPVGPMSKVGERAGTFTSTLSHLAARGAAALSVAVQLDPGNWQSWTDLGHNLLLQVSLQFFYLAPLASCHEKLV